MNPSEKLTPTQAILVGIVILVSLAVAYGNSFQAAWHYDDNVMIVNNDNVHMSSLSWNQIKRALGAGLDFQTVSRPLPYLSFALNYLWGGDDVFGYHLVNFTIHWLTAVLLFLLMRRTLVLPIFGGRYELRATCIAALAVLFWACHPIQVTAVTYIYQRMASLAGLFYVAALYAYCVGRSSTTPHTRYTAFALAVTSGVCAMLCKENTVMLLYTVLMYDLLFFRQLNRQTIGRSFAWTLMLSIFVLALAALYTDLKSLFDPYRIRPFTMTERLLTQPRVLFTYLGLIIVPMNARMALLHDVTVSHGLFDPWTTLFAILGIVLIVVLLIILAERHRLFAFCGLFFLLNHVVESSFVNLELIYEHRNYIPSMWLFVPLSVAVVRSYEWFYYRRSFQFLIIFTTVLVLVSNIHTTWSYNRIFRTGYSLWLHNVAIFPNLSLAHNNLGEALWKSGNLEDAGSQMQEALALDRYQNTQQQAVILYNLGLYEAKQNRDFNKAMDYFRKADAILPHSKGIWSQIVLMYMQLTDYASAINVSIKAIEKWPEYVEFRESLAICYVKLEQYQEALETISSVEATGTADPATVALVAAQSYRKTGRMDEALDRLLTASRIDPENRLLTMACIDLAHEMGRGDLVKRYASKLLKGHEHKSSVALKITLGNIAPYVPDVKRLESILAGIR